MEHPLQYLLPVHPPSATLLGRRNQGAARRHRPQTARRFRLAGSCSNRGPGPSSRICDVADSTSGIARTCVSDLGEAVRTASGQGGCTLKLMSRPVTALQRCLELGVTLDSFEVGVPGSCNTVGCQHVTSPPIMLSAEDIATGRLDPTCGHRATANFTEFQRQQLQQLPGVTAWLVAARRCLDENDLVGTIHALVCYALWERLNTRAVDILGEHNVQQLSKLAQQATRDLDATLRVPGEQPGERLAVVHALRRHIGLVVHAHSQYLTSKHKSHIIAGATSTLATGGSLDANTMLDFLPLSERYRPRDRTGPLVSRPPATTLLVGERRNQFAALATKLNALEVTQLATPLTAVGAQDIGSVLFSSNGISSNFTMASSATSLAAFLLDPDLILSWVEDSASRTRTSAAIRIGVCVPRAIAALSSGLDNHTETLTDLTDAHIVSTTQWQVLFSLLNNAGLTSLKEAAAVAQGIVT